MCTLVNSKSKCFLSFVSLGMYYVIGYENDISRVNIISCIYIPCTQTRYCLANNDTLEYLIKMLWVHVIIFLVLYTNPIMYGLHDDNILCSYTVQH